MNNLFFRLKNLPIYLFPAFIMSAAVLFLINIVSLIPSAQLNSVYEAFSSGASALFAFAGGSLIVYSFCKNTKKAVAAGYCILVFDMVLHSLCRVHISFVFAIILALFFAFFFEKFSLFYAFLMCALIGVTAALLLGLSYEFLYSLLKSFCVSLKGRGALFGAFNNAYSLLFSNNFSELFYHKDYSGTAYTGKEVVSGVMDIFRAQGVAGVNASKYLSGKYFVNIFLSIGIFALLYQRLSREVQAAFSLCFLLAVIFGDVRLFALFLLIYNPFMYFGYLLLIIISYLSAYLLDIRLVFFKEGSVFELIKYMDKPAYFLVSGAVLAVLSYFLESMILSKLDFQSTRILPSEVRNLISALGGERNIERINGGELIVRNANLINILKLDCDIRGNSIALQHDDLETLKKFLF